MSQHNYAAGGSGLFTLSTGQHMISCDPSVLANLASDFKKLSKKTLMEVQTYLLCQLVNAHSDCTQPPAPVLSVGFEQQNEAGLTWVQAVDPDLGFVLAYSATPGGPYTKFSSVPGSARDGTFFSESSGTFYIVVYARNTLLCVSPASNEVVVNV